MTAASTRDTRYATRSDVRAMHDEMVTWLAKQQVTDKNDPHYGAVYYRREDRYCSRDTACAAASFMRQYALTGDAKWKQAAERARDYALQRQKPHGGIPESRHREEADGGSAVSTSIIADNLIRAYRLGLEYGDRDLDALARMAAFELTLEWKPGAFYHDTNHVSACRGEDGKLMWGDEGSHKDCQNTTALSAMMLVRIADFLESAGREPDPEWRAAAGRAIDHLVEGQDPQGHWRYWIGVNWLDMGHHGMVMFHLAEAAEHEPLRNRKDVLAALVKGADWLMDAGLMPSKWGTKLDWSIEWGACIYFTHSYFLLSAPLVRLGRLDPERGAQWRHQGLELMRYVRTRLWDQKFGDYETDGPFRPTENDLCYGCAWFGQSLGWCLYLLDDVIEQMGWWEDASG